MNLGTFTARLALNVGNIRSTDPWYPYLDQYANDALRLMLLRASEKFPNFQLFPEHKDVEWIDITVADQAYLTLPSDAFTIMRVFSADSAAVPNTNDTNWRVVTWIDPKGIDQQTKPTTQLDYPSNYTQREGRVYLYPTPRATKTTYVKIDGIQDEVNMSSPTDTPRTHERWHPAWLDYGCFMLANDRGMTEDAQRFLGACDAKIKDIGTSLMGMRRANTRRTIRVAGMPR